MSGVMKKLVVTTAMKFEGEDKRELESKLLKTFGSSEIEYHVDEELLGGVVIFDGTTVYDGSLKTKLETISKVLKKE